MTALQYDDMVMKHADALFRFAFSMLGDKMDAEDVVQGVFERLWAKHQQVEIVSTKTYLFTSVHRACIDVFRKRRSTKKVLDTLSLDQRQFVPDQLEKRQLAEHILQYLDEGQRALVLLRDYEGYSYKEIGEIAGLTLAQVKIKLFRARQKIQDVLHLDGQCTNQIN
ncbi:MAG: RNA polymerase sigma factor [Saprospiraceae bacterium]|nr:RNA polymerase sigma factor [Saprospiraceae bacterium]